MSKTHDTVTFYNYIPSKQWKNIDKNKTFFLDCVFDTSKLLLRTQKQKLRINKYKTAPKMHLTAKNGAP